MVRKNEPIETEVLGMLAMEKEICVRSYEIGPNDVIRINSLVQHMQEIASLHADRLGVGLDWLVENERMWVLVNLRIDMDRLPGWREAITLYTWPSGMDGLLAFREFSGTGLKDKELFRASSEWLVLNQKSRRPLMLDDIEFNIPVIEKRFFGKLPRLKGFQIEDEPWTIEVPNSSIDRNGHVNNTEYIRWACDTAARNGADISKISSFHITFISEIFQSEKLRLSSKETETGMSITGIKENGKTAFSAEIGLDP